MPSRQKEVLPDSIALTFDDGYDNFIHAASFWFSQFQTPAMFFISTVSLAEVACIADPRYNFTFENGCQQQISYVRIGDVDFVFA
jgi:hypothetical protein